jgi:transposase
MESLSTTVVAATAVATPQKKRQWRSVGEKRRIVEESLVSGASVALVAREYGVNANQLFGWRRLYRTGQLVEKRSKPVPPSVARLLPVKVCEDGQKPEMVAADTAARIRQARRTEISDAPAGAIHIQFSRAQVHVEGSADPAALRVVLECLLR